MKDDRAVFANMGSSTSHRSIVYLARQSASYSSTIERRSPLTVLETRHLSPFFVFGMEKFFLSRRDGEEGGMNAQEAGGFAKVRLCPAGAHHTMVRLGGELAMMAPTWCWSVRRRPYGRVQLETVFQRISAITRTAHRNAISAHGASTAIAPAPFNRPRQIISIRRPPDQDRRGQTSCAPVVLRPAVSLGRPAHCNRRSSASAALRYRLFPSAAAHTALAFVSRILTPGCPADDIGKPAGLKCNARVHSSLAFPSMFCMPCFACLLVPLCMSRNLCMFRMFCLLSCFPCVLCQ